MSKEEKFCLMGEVLDILRDMEFVVELENKKVIRANLSGRMRTKNIRVLRGDRVKVEISPYDLSVGRIVYRE